MSWVRVVLGGWLAMMGAFSSAQADEGVDLSRSEVEVYGNVQFLLRITEEEKLGVNVHAGNGQYCTIDEKVAAVVVEEVLASHNRLGKDNKPHHFRLDVDHFSVEDEGGHCLMSYEVYLTQNILKEAVFAKMLEEDFGYEYENSTPLLKINGILHVDQPMLADTFKKELKVVTGQLLKALTHLQREVRRDIPN